MSGQGRAGRRLSSWGELAQQDVVPRAGGEEGGVRSPGGRGPCRSSGLLVVPAQGGRRGRRWAGPHVTLRPALDLSSSVASGKSSCVSVWTFSVARGWAPGPQQSGSIAPTFAVMSPWRTTDSAPDVSPCGRDPAWPHLRPQWRRGGRGPAGGTGIPDWSRRLASECCLLWWFWCWEFCFLPGAWHRGWTSD